VLRLYALAEHPVKLPDASQLDATPLTAVGVDRRLDAIVGEVDETAREATEAAVLAHARVVEALAALNDAVLPARFAQGVADEAELAERIKPRRPQLLAALERVRGCVEVGLRVLEAAAGNGKQDRASGRDYMLGRLEAVRRAERLAAEFHESLAALARDSSHRVVASPPLVLTAAYLVPRAELESFRAAVEAAGRRRSGLTFVCTGPWPPYSFALIEADGS
jgi:hypothetical protein